MEGLEGHKHDGTTTGNGRAKISRRDVKLKKIGEGVSGCIDLYQSKLTLDTYVVKTYHCREKYETKTEYQKRVLHEYNILRVLRNVHVIEVYKDEISWFGSTVRVYMEAGAADLSKILKGKKSEARNKKEMLCLWKQLCYGIDYLHNTAKICHRDLKLDNLVLDLHSGMLKIIDLATAFEFSRDPDTGACGNQEYEAIGLVGSDSYIAPETVAQFRYDGKKADIWSVGIILFNMLNAKFPWKSARLSDRKYVAYCNRDAAKGSTDMGFATISDYLPSESHVLVTKLLEVDPLKRANIRDCFEDDWFNNLGVCDDSTCGLDHSMLVKGA